MVKPLWYPMTKDIHREISIGWRVCGQTTGGDLAPVTSKHGDGWNSEMFCALFAPDLLQNIDNLNIFTKSLHNKIRGVFEIPNWKSSSGRQKNPPCSKRFVIDFRFCQSQRRFRPVSLEHGRFDNKIGSNSEDHLRTSLRITIS